MTGDEDQIRSPRALFARRFTELYEAAGNPTLRRVATAAENRMRAAQGARPGGASAQRISDWKAGRNVPARFESLLPVVLTLIDLTRKSAHPLPRPLADPKEWQRLWQAATTWNPDADSESPCPYPGLTAYNDHNRTLFFGRTRATTELADLMRTATGIVVVIGASGAGKSSLLAAGLIPALPDWETTLFTPGTDPLVPTALAPRDGGPCRLLVIDQAEELFTVCAEREREDFLALLDACATRADDPIAVVLAVRADFYPHCLNHLVLQDALEHRSYLLGPMRTDELAQAISGPARAVGLELEPGLEELVITELCGAGDHHGRRTYDPGALPLLSHVMAATWQHREGRRLTTTGYRKAGGVVGSVAETAEYAWNELSPAQQTAARDLLLGLVTVRRDARDTRRPALRSDLLARAANPQDATAALELLSHTRLLTLDADAVTLTHEIVLTAWPRLRTWIDEDRVGYLVRQRLESDAAEWAAQERDPSLLYRGTRLRNALDNVDPPPVGPLAQEFLTTSAAARTRVRRRSTRTKGALALLSVVLLMLGFTAYTQTRLAREQRDARNLAAVLDQADRLRHTDPSLAAQLYLVAQQLHPDDPEVRTRLLRTQNMPLMTTTHAHDMGLTGMVYRKDGPLATVDWNNQLRLWNVTDPYHPAQLGAPIEDAEFVALSPNGLMATAKEGSGFQLWDIGNPADPHRLAVLPAPPRDRGFPQDFLALVFADNGRALVTATTASVTVWDLTNPAAPVAGPPYELYSTLPEGLPVPHIRISPDGHVLALTRRSDEDSTPSADVSMTESVTLLRVGDGTSPTILSGPLDTGRISVADMAFSPDGTLLAVSVSHEQSNAATGGKSAVQLWSIADPRSPRQIGTILADSSGRGGDTIGPLAFSPDSHVLALSTTGGVSLWNVTEPVTPGLIADDLSTGTSICRYPSSKGFPCSGGPAALVFGPDGRTLLATGRGGEIQTWSLPPAMVTGHSGRMSTPRFDASGNRMMTESTDGRIALWDTSDPQQPIRFGEYRLPTDAYGADLSPDGRTLLVESGRFRRTASLVDLSDPAHIHVSADWSSPPDRRTIRISPDWRRMATITDGNAVQLWDLADRSHPVALGAPIAFDKKYSNITVTFGNDDTTLFVQKEHSKGMSSDIALSRWDIRDPAHPRELNDLIQFTADLGSHDLILTPDQRTLIRIEHETAHIWDLGDPAHPVPLADPVTLDTRSIVSLAFTPDSRFMVSSGGDAAIQLWDFTDRARPRRIGSPLTESTDKLWNAVIHPSGRVIIGVGSNGAIRLWNLDDRHATNRICAITGSMWTEDLWHRYLPQLPYHPPCPAS
ncbi:nSTAND1 domain-containing NTPase [Nocardia sp. CDC160]|uniref:nSTAND1 domain-containing NTPase n=1 Tax=Nocardia sp. CDC160 TaxID=3112166 RepID=UPI002DB9D4BA|nr:hypothetical protein [Nocardia sp. CDC160]MEC3913185.1 hypothetical protein [Nocardia sp. CDC160]